MCPTRYIRIRRRLEASCGRRRVQKIQALELTQIEALAILHEFSQRLMDQLPLGPDPAQSLRFADKLRVELDVGSHEYTLLCV